MSYLEEKITRQEGDSKWKYDELMSQYNTLKEQKEDLIFTETAYKDYVEWLKKFIDMLALQVEEETKIRGQFEAKINTMFSIIRD